MTLPPDMIAYNLAIQLDIAIEEIRKAADTIPVGQAERILAATTLASEGMRRLSDQLDPCADYTGAPAPTRPPRPRPVNEPGSNVIQLFPAAKKPDDPA